MKLHWVVQREIEVNVEIFGEKKIQLSSLDNYNWSRMEESVKEKLKSMRSLYSSL